MHKIALRRGGQMDNTWPQAGATFIQQIGCHGSSERYRHRPMPTPCGGRHFMDTVFENTAWRISRSEKKHLVTRRNFLHRTLFSKSTLIHGKELPKNNFSKGRKIDTPDTQGPQFGQVRNFGPWYVKIFFLKVVGEKKNFEFS